MSYKLHFLGSSAWVASLGGAFFLAFAPVNTTPQPGKTEADRVYVWVETEQMQVSPPLTAAEDTSASGGKYIWLPPENPVYPCEKSTPIPFLFIHSNLFPVMRQISNLFWLLALLLTGSISQAQIIEYYNGCSKDGIREQCSCSGGTVTTVNSPVRTSENNCAFRHAYPAGTSSSNYRAETGFKTTDIGGTYWYGYSMYLPSSGFNPTNWVILNQWAAYPTDRDFSESNGGCGGVGHKTTIENNNLYFKLVHPTTSGTEGMQCEISTLLSGVPRNVWIDFVMQAKWTGNTDGFVTIWLQINGGGYQQKYNYTGRTWFNDEGRGPYLKLGLYGRNNHPDLAAYFDEIRLAGANSTFDQVRPDQGGTTPTGTDSTDPLTGTISARGENGTNESAAKAFDNSPSTKWLNFINGSGNNGALPSWIQYTYASGEKYTVTAYTLTSANDAPERDPKDFKLYGVKDDNTLQLLDTRTNVSFSARFEKQTFSINNTTAYKGYRVEITAVKNAPATANSVQLAEIELLGAKASSTSTATTRRSFGPEAITGRMFVYPTLTDGECTLQLPAAAAGEITVTDAMGRVVLRKSTDARQTAVPLKITGKPGVYMVKLQQGGSVHTTRLVKQ